MIQHSTAMYRNVSVSVWSSHLYVSGIGMVLIPGYIICKTFEVRNCENMENALKINVFEMSILFCKYLWNRSSDLYEILCGGQLLSCELRFKFHEDP